MVECGEGVALKGGRGKGAAKGRVYTQLCPFEEWGLQSVFRFPVGIFV